eukprot:CAMPEP_0202923756 /NCGR_PEP_ID=MMETSP1392-20130828/78617_1 /ASSEMBLY_ACC=CAM_ASM_000868 /TAXON_ID=225041 /ORGANISM="Chlamydomonas chlamydogama, Strain SAG 11-48b" /LENGTH=107 /DNA_ID=CAMNT_0049617455 /DNA_START=130 /DNA_END=453 /DNA_ORIENTATION=+
MTLMAGLCAGVGMVEPISCMTPGYRPQCIRDGTQHDKAHMPSLCAELKAQGGLVDNALHCVLMSAVLSLDIPALPLFEHKRMLFFFTLGVQGFVSHDCGMNSMKHRA